MIKKVYLENLYGEFTHTIDIKEGGITLILGENGLGKTIILKMIKYLFDNDLYELGNYEFKLFTISFKDNSTLEIQKEISNQRKSIRFEDYTLTITYKKESKKNSQKFQIKSDDILENYKSERRGIGHRRQSSHRFYNFIRHFIPKPLDQVGPDRWLDLENGVIFSSSELVEKYIHYFPSEIIEELRLKSIPDWYTSITKLINVKLVETQRLLMKINSEEKEYKSSVVQYSNELKEIIKNKAIEATNLSTKLDRTYTNRLIEKITSTNTTSNTSIDQSLKALEEKRLFLIKVGLLEHDDEALLPINLNQNYRDNETLRDVLDIYIEDSYAKLAVYHDLSEKLNTLMVIINKRFMYKEFFIDKNAGFIFKSSKTGKTVPLSNLSSGEQHELVLFYELLFNTPEKSLILIDEPEISLHINWQNEFINDLRDISRLTDINSVIATHSPDIINNNWDLTIEL